MRRACFIFTIFLLIFVSFVMSLDVSAADVEEDVTILFTHDLHDNFYPFHHVEDGESKSVGGYARLYSAIQHEKEQYPDALLVDAGDYSMGSLFQTINMSDAPELRMMGHMGYDVTTFGNHEFDYRAEGLARSLEAAKESGDDVPEIVASNMTFPTDDQGNLSPSLQSLKDAIDDYGVSEYTIMEQNGVKIGLFGLMGKEAADDAPMSGVDFEDIAEGAKPVVKQLREEEEVDVVIALSHSGTSADSSVSEDEILADKVSGIDVIISGHSHTVLPEPILVDDTIIVSSGEYGKNLGTLRISPSSDDGWQVDDYEIIPIDEELEEDPDTAEKIEAFKEVVQERYLDQYDMEYDEVLAHSDFAFAPFSKLGKQHQEEPMGNLIGDAYIHTVREMEGDAYEPIAAAVVPVGPIRDSFVEGDITVSDVFDVSPLGVGADGVPGYPLVNIYLTGKELKTVAEVDASITPILSDVQLFVAGLQYEFNPNRMIFNRVTDVKKENADGSYEDLDNDTFYRVVAGLYSAQMLPVVQEKSFNLLSLEPKNKEGDPIEDFEEEIIYWDDDDQQELKEWFALARYLETFDKSDGVPQLSSYYNQTHERKIVNDNTGIIEFFKKPNGIALSVYAIVVVFIGLVVLVVRWVVKKVKRRKR